jgi:hypothetical protein
MAPRLLSTSLACELQAPEEIFFLKKPRVSGAG